MKVGNIVSQNKVKVSDDFNVVKSMDEIIHGLPTLIVGYDYVNKNYPDFDITSNSLDIDIYWTFKRTERRDKYEEDLSLFVSISYNKLVQNIDYIFIDPIQYSKKKMYKILRKLYSLKNKISYLNNNMIYIYSENLIFGIDLKLASFTGSDSTKIKNKIKEISSVFLDDDKILIEYRKNVGLLSDKVRYVPFLFSLRNGQNNITSFIHIPRKD